MSEMTTAYDEMVSGQGALRPHWREIMASVWAMPPEMLREKQARATAHLAGVDNLIADFSGGASHEGVQPDWSIDLLPLILPASEWQSIAEGLAQRAAMLNLVLSDIYGSQSLIQEGLLPPYLVFNNPSFLRPLRHVPQPGNAPMLHFYAADMVRMPDGTWRILADRTQASAGVGYALRHRSVVARTFPEAFRNAQARRLQPTLELWQSSLQAIGSAISDNPRIVLLTPGPHNHAFLEHVLLAHELGIGLVQGADLTVRNGIVYLKTLDGLVRVDVIYRRVDGDYCDPLELRGDSTLGVAGLIGAMRAGTVAVLNMPGSAVVETPAFAPFLPGLTQHLLGQDLALPSVTTWWCGQRDPLAAVQDLPDDFLLRKTFDASSALIDPTLLSASERDDLSARLISSPDEYVAVQRVDHGLAPTLEANGLEPRPVVLRACVIWHDGVWVPMPGGVARVADSANQGALLRDGYLVKDVWVLSDDAANETVAVTGKPEAEIREATPMTDVLGSRTADDLFWLGRYVERLDSGLRQFRAAFTRLTGGNLGPRDTAELQMLTNLLYRCGWVTIGLARSLVGSTVFIAEITAAPMAGGPLAACQSSIRQLGIALRDRLSRDMWRTINQLFAPFQFQVQETGGRLDVLLEHLDRSLDNVAAFNGLVAENMTRGGGWRFLEIGRRIERGTFICNIIGDLMNARPLRIELSVRLALELCDSIITYRKRYSRDPYSLPALEVVLSDSTNPRSLMYQLTKLQSELDALIGQDPLASEGVFVDRLIAELRGAVTAGADPAQPFDVTAATLAAATDKIENSLLSLSDMLSRSYFSHVNTAQSLILGGRSLQQSVAS